MSVVSDLISDPVKAIQSCTFRTDPSIAIFIYVDRENNIPTQRVWIFGIIAVVRKDIALTIIFVYAAPIRSKPQYTTTIFVDRYNVIKAQTLRISRIILIMDKSCPSRAQAIQSIRGSD